MNLPRIVAFIEKSAPEYWYSYATELFDSAESVCQNYESEFVRYFICSAKENRVYDRPLLSRPATLLFGFAIENLLKGIIISENPYLLEKGSLDKKLISHDLLALSHQVTSLDLQPKQISILKYLSDALPYFSRYPIPLRADAVRDEDFFALDMRSEVVTIFRTLEILLYKLNYNGISAPHGVTFPKLRLPHLDHQVDFATDTDFDFAPVHLLGPKP